MLLKVREKPWQIFRLESPSGFNMVSWDIIVWGVIWKMMNQPPLPNYVSIHSYQHASIQVTADMFFGNKKRKERVRKDYSSQHCIPHAAKHNSAFHMRLHSPQGIIPVLSTANWSMVLCTSIFPRVLPGSCSHIRTFPLSRCPHFSSFRKMVPAIAHPSPPRLFSTPDHSPSPAPQVFGEHGCCPFTPLFSHNTVPATAGEVTWLIPWWAHRSCVSGWNARPWHPASSRQLHKTIVWSQSSWGTQEVPNC